MDRNPYAPPRSGRLELRPERPRRVLVATILLSIVVLSSLRDIGSTWSETGEGSDPLPSPYLEWFIATMAGAIVLAYALSAWLIFKIHAGANWARWAYLVLAIAGDAFFIWNLDASQPSSRYEPALTFCTMAVELVPLYLLFTGPARHWFRR